MKSEHIQLYIELQRAFEQVVRRGTMHCDGQCQQTKILIDSIVMPFHELHTFSMQRPRHPNGEGGKEPFKPSISNTLLNGTMVERLNCAMERDGDGRSEGDGSRWKLSVYLWLDKISQIEQKPAETGMSTLRQHN